MSPAKPRFLPHLPADFLAEHQLAGIRWSVQQAMKSPQYRAKLAAAGIACGEDIKTLDDVRRLPFSDVADLRDGAGEPIREAVHPHMAFSLRCEGPAPRGAILRRRLEGAPRR